MAGVIGRVSTPQIALAAATAKTVLQLVAPSNHRVKVQRLSVSFEGTNTTDAPVQIDIVRQTTAGTSTGTTPVKDNDSDAETLQTTANRAASDEPTTTDLLDSKMCHPQGRIDFGPFTIPGGGRIGIRCNAPNAVDCIASAVFEE
ncbi:hypothetical protein [Anatilimnocola floriformis]|uniref:hypothetical protein n=1 Tax=Anatilimnocola floriformis TaxID=2948575 RepID=UPI0020C3175A|nr:hypothetical protein [Anatilimnocola floriformis]